MIFIRWVLLFLLPLASASPIFDSLFGGKGKSADPAVLDLPYGSFKSEYNKDTDIHVFRNVPYAAPPVGDLRWAKPAPPLKQSSAQKPGPKPICPQATIQGLNFLGPGNEGPIGSVINQLLGDIPIPEFGEESEDCLYMDIYVPAKAIREPEKPLPVVVWIFGGGFVLGSKDIYQPAVPLYDGTGLIHQSQNNLIFISFNYRLGAFGFLAGSSMERDALPNAGLWDQRAVFEWVREYAHLLGGDPGKVTAMGESAGASSIMHHLVAEGGTLDPLFHRAILLSPAFQPMWDRAGKSEDTFHDFAKLAGCEGQGLECLRKADAGKLMAANRNLMLQQPSGVFAVGPTPDGSFIRQLPSLELAAGNFWPLDAPLLLSHCAHEAIVFVDGSVATDADFSAYLAAVGTNYTHASGLNDKVRQFYPPVNSRGGGSGGGKKYATEADRTEALVRDSSMTCNIRYLNEAYGDDRSYNMQYSVGPGWHATDLLSVFYNPFLPSTTSSGSSWTDVLAGALLLPVGFLFAGVSTAMQSYLASYAMEGDPNARRAVLNVPPAVKWNHPRSGEGETVGRVLDVGNFLVREVEDGQMPKSACDFWREFYAAVTEGGGYAPTGPTVP